MRDSFRKGGSKGAATATNGVAEIIEAGTGENFVRNSFVFNGNDAAYSAYRDAMKTAAEVGTAICNAYYAYKGGNVCFIAGTLIATEDGQKAIEDIEVGDLVWATYAQQAYRFAKKAYRNIGGDFVEGLMSSFYEMYIDKSISYYYTAIRRTK